MFSHLIILFLLLLPTKIAPCLSVVSFFPHIRSPVDTAGGNVREEVVEDFFNDEEYYYCGKDDDCGHMVIVFRRYHLDTAYKISS